MAYVMILDKKNPSMDQRGNAHYFDKNGRYVLRCLRRLTTGLRTYEQLKSKELGQIATL